MKKIAWITDSTCGLSKQFIEEHNIFVLPLSVLIDGISYRDDIDLTKKEVYEKLRVHGEGAKTSQPAFGEFMDLYERLKTEYEKGIAIHASSQLTGTYQSSKEAVKQTGFDVEVIDSKIGSYALGKMIKNGLELQEEGKSYEDIVAELKLYPERTEMYLLPQSLNQLKNSGRVTTSQMIFANLLNIYLLLGFDQGKVVVYDKIRTKKKAKKKIYELIHEAVEVDQIKELSVMHAGAEEEALEWKEELEHLYPEVRITMEVLVAVAGVHTGYGTLSVSWLRNS